MSKQERQAFIAETLKAKGYINRSDIKERFGVGDATAASDFALFKAANNGGIKYNNVLRRYEKYDV